MSEVARIFESPLAEFEWAHQRAVSGEGAELLGRIWDVPFETHYLISPGLSSHGLMDILRSPAHYYANKFINKDEPTPAMVRGRLLHLAVLEPKRFRENFRVAPSLPRNTTKGKDAYAKFISSLKPTDIVVKQEEADQIIAMINALFRCKVAWNLILSGQSEMSGWWRDEKGYLCKYRGDKIIEDHGIILDYKTARDASFEGFKRAIYQYKYDMQAHWYMTGGSKTMQRPPKKFIFIAQEPEAPFAVGVYVANDAIFDLGERRVNIAKSRFERCLDREAELRAKKVKYSWEDVWDAYPDRAVDIDPPHYAFSDLEVVNEFE